MDVVTEAYQDGVFSLTLNRPEKKNAMSLELLEALYRALKNAETTRGIDYRHPGGGEDLLHRR